MKSAVKKRLGLVLMLPTLCILLALGSFHWFLAETRNDNAFINIAGLQHKLARELMTFTHMVHIGQEEDKEELMKAMAAFEENLGVLERGGRAMARLLPPLPAKLMDELAAMKKVWVEIKPALAAIAGHPAASAEAPSAYELVAREAPGLADAAYALMLAHEDRSDRLRDRMLYMLMVVALLIFVSAMASIWVIRRYSEEQRMAEAKLRREKEEQEALVRRLKDAQSQLLQSEKLASIGQLAAGVAHEINNPVGYISSNIGSLKHSLDDLLRLIDCYEGAEDKLDDAQALAAVRALKQEIDLDFLKEDLHSLLSESEEGVSRVRQIVQDLKDFSHMDEVEWQWADLHKGLNSTLNIVNNELKYKAEVVKEYGDLPQVECIISQLNQVFMNLLVNAAHAIEERGLITVRTGTEGKNAWVEIEDTGKGMDAETQKRIFDPFFTTKGVGEGTGLGLSLSYGIIQKHGGSISVESEPGRGTIFRVCIPIEQAGQKAA